VVTDSEIIGNDFVRPSGNKAIKLGAHGRSIQDLDPLRFSRRDPVMNAERGWCGTKQKAGDVGLLDRSTAPGFIASIAAPKKGDNCRLTLRDLRRPRGSMPSISGILTSTMTHPRLDSGDSIEENSGGVVGTSCELGAPKQEG
jgi:hypothetical protein